MSVHIIGIGGIGTSGLAVYLKAKGFIVTGSDKTLSSKVKELKLLNIPITIGSNEEFVDAADVVIYSSAISQNDCELRRAKLLKKVIYTRAQALGLIVKSHALSIGICGSHGKTSSVSMLAHILKCSNYNFTAFIGGDDSEFNNAVIVKDNKIILTEICEYQRNLRDVKPKVAVCLNIDNDHLDTYGSIKGVKNEFFKFLNGCDTAIVNADDRYLKTFQHPNLITFGINNSATYSAKNLKENGGKYSFEVYKNKSQFIKIKLNAYGLHSVYNALACIAVGDTTFNISKENLEKGILEFKFVKRRFEELGMLLNKKAIADYCHHPNEILDTIKVLKSLFNNDYLIVFQPHTFSRTQMLFDDFVKVFKGQDLIVYNTYSARESFSELGSSERLANSLKAYHANNITDLKERIKLSNKSNLIVLGAGNLYDIIKEEIKNV